MLFIYFLKLFLRIPEREVYTGRAIMLVHQPLPEHRWRSTAKERPLQLASGYG